MRFSPDEIKSLALHYGSYNKAAKALGIGKASLVDAANADIKGKSYKLSEKNSQKINDTIKSFTAKEKKDFKQWEKALAFNATHPRAKKAFMNLKPADREWAKKHIAQFKTTMTSRDLWGDIMSKFYDKYGWQAGRFRK